MITKGAVWVAVLVMVVCIYTFATTKIGELLGDADGQNVRNLIGFVAVSILCAKLTDYIAGKLG
jgi:hypothetical protein